MKQIHQVVQKLRMCKGNHYIFVLKAVIYLLLAEISSERSKRVAHIVI